MRLVAQSARDRNPGERKGSHTDTGLERSKQLSDAHLDENRKIHRGYLVRQVQETDAKVSVAPSREVQNRVRDERA
jgi:hypothetical protein